ncbi:hypothetical protein Q9R34_11215 [Enterobacter sp. BRE11]|nr:hypothetical protein [Enterobacter sp. BRE11]
MKYYIAGLALLVSGQIMADAMPAQAYPSCDIQAQRDVKEETGGRIADPLQAHISWRINVLQADISTARKARRLTQAQADRLWQHASQIRGDAAHYVKQQGFLSAAERASFDRALDQLASQLCSKVA